MWTACYRAVSSIGVVFALLPLEIGRQQSISIVAACYLVVSVKGEGKRGRRNERTWRSAVALPRRTSEVCLSTHRSCSDRKYSEDFWLLTKVCSFLEWQVHLDHKHMGVGGDDSWSPSVHDEYLVHPVPCSFSIRLCPIYPSTSSHDIYKSQISQ
ncbi:hypothetical protein BHM03_00015942 [Ensete ventricosum]|nr:hypothetical protein BHM03_00015942 [Ensete ventricosum]